MAETNGPFMSDICRLAALQLHGGYYFDNDMRTVQAWEFDDGRCSFASSWAYREPRTTYKVRHMMQSFLAVPPNHAIINATFREMLRVYEPQRSRAENTTRIDDTTLFLGPPTMGVAYNQTIGMMNHQKNSSNHCMLHEDLLGTLRRQNKTMYAKVPLQQGTGWGCNFVMHHPVERVVYFFSRMVGTSHKACGFFKEKEEKTSTREQEEATPQKKRKQHQQKKRHQQKKQQHQQKKMNKHNKQRRRMQISTR